MSPHGRSRLTFSRSLELCVTCVLGVGWCLPQNLWSAVNSGGSHMQVDTYAILEYILVVWPTTKGRIKMVLDPAEENLGLRYLGQSKIVPLRKGWNLEPSQPR